MIFISESSSSVTLISILYSAKSNPHSICRLLSVVVDAIRFTMISRVFSGFALQFLLIWLISYVLSCFTWMSLVQGCKINGELNCQWYPCICPLEGMSGKVILLNKPLDALLQFFYSCELKVCTTKNPENPHVLLTFPVIPELSALCIILAFALKGEKNVCGNNA